MGIFYFPKNIIKPSDQLNTNSEITETLDLTTTKLLMLKILSS